MWMGGAFSFLLLLPLSNSRQLDAIQWWPIHAVRRCRPLESTRTNFQLENAMNNQVSRPDCSHLKSFFCALREEKFPDLRESLILSWEKNKPLLNGDTSGISGLFRGVLKSGTLLYHELLRLPQRCFRCASVSMPFPFALGRIPFIMLYEYCFVVLFCRSHLRRGERGTSFVFRFFYFYDKSVCESTFLEIYFFKNCPEGKICGKFLKKKGKMYFIEGRFDQKLR